jgi:hypothetical protein
LFSLVHQLVIEYEINEFFWKVQQQLAFLRAIDFVLQFQHLSSFFHAQLTILILALTSS